MGNHLLEIWSQNLVGNGLAVDRVELGRVGDFVDPVDRRINIEAGRRGDGTFTHRIPDSVRIEVGDGHRMHFRGCQRVVVPVDRWVDTEREDVLMVGGQYTRLDNSSPGHRHALVNGLGTHNSRGAHLVTEFAGLIEDEGQDVFVVCYRDDRLEDEFTRPHDRGIVRAIVGVFPANAGVLLMNADDVFHGKGLTVRGGEDGGQVVDRSQAVAAEFEIVGHYSRARVAKVEGRLAVERSAGVPIGDVHIGQGCTIDETSIIVPDLFSLISFHVSYCAAHV